MLTFDQSAPQLKSGLPAVLPVKAVIFPVPLKRSLTQEVSVLVCNLLRLVGVYRKLVWEQFYVSVQSMKCDACFCDKSFQTFIRG